MHESIAENIKLYPSLLRVAKNAYYKAIFVLQSKINLLKLIKYFIFMIEFYSFFNQKFKKKEII